MDRIKQVMIVLGMALIALTSTTFGAAVISGERKVWHKITVTFDGPASSETATPNPFTDYRLNVTFTNGTSTYLVPGYFAADGDAANTSATSGGKWRVHLRADAPGTWTYTASFRTGTNIAISDDANAGTAVASIDGATGTIAVTASDKSAPDLRAKGTLQYVNKRYLQFKGTGEYFLKTGTDSPENFLATADFDNTPNNGNRRKTWTAHVGDWVSGDPEWKGGLGHGIIGAVNYLSSEGQNSFSFLTMNITGDDKNVFPYISDVASDYTRFDCSKCDQWEIVFDHGEHKGMHLHFKTQETENDQLLNNGDLGTERKMYYRELIARFGHHLALNWNLGEENTQTTQQRKDMANYFWTHDPYKHNIVMHTGLGGQETAYRPLLGALSQLTGVSLQVNYSSVHAEVKQWVDESNGAGKPWVVANDEQGNASVGIPPDPGYPGYTVGTPTQDQCRYQTLWGALLAGGDGVEYYFGYNVPQSDLNCQDFRSRNRWFDYGRFAVNFLQLYVPFTEMVSGDQLTSATDDFVFAKAGVVYVIYKPAGGTTNLNLSGVSGSFAVQWFDPRNGGALQTGSVSSISGGSSSVSIGNPPAPTSSDWVCLVRGTTGIAPFNPVAGSGLTSDLPLAVNSLNQGKISFTMPAPGRYAISVYTMTGAMVFGTISGSCDAGANTAVLPKLLLGNQVYVVSLQQGAKTVMRKMTPMVR